MIRYIYKMDQGELGMWRTLVELDEPATVLHITNYSSSEQQALKDAQEWVEKEWPKYRSVLPSGEVTDGTARLKKELNRMGKGENDGTTDESS